VIFSTGVSSPLRSSFRIRSRSCSASAIVAKHYEDVLNTSQKSAPAFAATVSILHDDVKPTDACQTSDARGTTLLLLVACDEGFTKKISKKTY